VRAAKARMVEMIANFMFVLVMASFAVNCLGWGMVDLGIWLAIYAS